VILKTFDAVTAMRDEGRTLIGGFHSPMEWECLGILLRGRQPVIWVPARSIGGMHLKPQLQPAFAAGRLLILSPFEPKHKRIMVALADARNRFVGALADRVFIAHAAPASRTLALAEALRDCEKPLLTVDDPANEILLEFAAKVRVGTECDWPPVSAPRASWASSSLSTCDALGGNWGNSGVHVWVNSGKDG
jgi:hypothetical protein